MNIARLGVSWILRPFICVGRLFDPIIFPCNRQKEIIKNSYNNQQVVE